MNWLGLVGNFVLAALFYALGRRSGKRAAPVPPAEITLRWSGSPTAAEVDALVDTVRLARGGAKLTPFTAIPSRERLSP